MVAVQVTLCLVPLCGVTAFAIDVGLMMEYRRRVLAATDAAALAAADDLYQNYSKNGGLDPGGTASTSATAAAAANGFSANSTLTVNIPPLSGPFTGKAGYAEVILVYQMTRGFSSVLGLGSLPIQSRSVARGLWAAFNNGIILLDPTSSGALTDSGNGTVTVTGGSIIIDSSSATAARATGNGTVTAPEIVITGTPGDVTTGNSKFVGGIDSGANPTVDPLLYLTAPDPSSLTVQSSSQYKLSGNQSATLNPGVYTGGISFSGNASAVLNPGIYYLNGGGLNVSGGSISGSGVMIYNDPGSGNGVINVSGSGSVSLTPPASGPYQGITLFQNRTSTNQITISGGSAMNVTGTFYAPKAMMNITGSAANTVAGSQYISYDLNISGSGSLNLTGADATVATTRQLGLVE